MKGYWSLTLLGEKTTVLQVKSLDSMIIVSLMECYYKLNLMNQFNYLLWDRKEPLI